MVKTQARFWTTNHTHAVLVGSLSHFSVFLLFIHTSDVQNIVAPGGGGGEHWLFLEGWKLVRVTLEQGPWLIDTWYESRLNWKYLMRTSPRWPASAPSTYSSVFASCPPTWHATLTIRSTFLLSVDWRVGRASPACSCSRPRRPGSLCTPCPTWASPSPACPSGRSGRAWGSVVNSATRGHFFIEASVFGNLS